MTPLLRAVITGACSCILAGIIIRLLLPVLHALREPLDEGKNPFT